MTTTTEIEIERRFLTPPSALAALTLDGAIGTFITQGYPPELTQLGCIGRVRQIHNRLTGEQRYECTTKQPLPSGLGVTETTTHLTCQEAMSLFGAASKRVLRKLRHTIVLEPGIVAMIDRFSHIRTEPVELIITEIEFDPEHADQAMTFVPPAWAGTEITGQPGWSNYELCLNGVPVH